MEWQESKVSLFGNYFQKISKFFPVLEVSNLKSPSCYSFHKSFRESIKYLNNAD